MYDWYKGKMVWANILHINNEKKKDKKQQLNIKIPTLLLYMLINQN